MSIPELGRVCEPYVRDAVSPDRAFFSGPVKYAKPPSDRWNAAVGRLRGRDHSDASDSLRRCTTRVKQSCDVQLYVQLEKKKNHSRFMLIFHR